MDAKNEEINRGLEKAAVRYVEDTDLKSAIQAIPYIGGPLDTLLSGKGTQIQKHRIEVLLQELDFRLKKIEGRVDVPDGDDFYDFMVGVFEGAVRSKTQKKISRFGAIVANQLIGPQSWDQAETATRLLRELEDIHLEILFVVMNAPVNPIDGKRLCTVLKPLPNIENFKGAKSLVEQFPQYKEFTISLVCSELVSKGLLYDDGVGRFGVRAMQMFSFTDSAEWLTNYIHE